METTPSIFGFPTPKLFRHKRIGVCIFHTRLGSLLALAGILGHLLNQVGQNWLPDIAIIGIGVFAWIASTLGTVIFVYFLIQLKKAQG